MPSHEPQIKNEATLIYMETFVRNFSEVMVSEEASEDISNIIVEWLEYKLHDMYLNTQNVKWVKYTH